MENAADALKIIFGFFIFVFAVSLSISTFSNARQAIDNIIIYRDKTESYIEVQKANNNNRTVGVETIVPAIYQAYKENYKIVFLKKNNSGEEVALYLYKKSDYRGTEREDTLIKYIDLGEEKNELIVKALLKNKDISSFSEYTTNHKKRVIYDNYSETFSQVSNLYELLSKHQFEERIGEYYQEDEDAGKETQALEINKTKKRVITYVMQN